MKYTIFDVLKEGIFCCHITESDEGDGGIANKDSIDIEQVSTFKGRGQEHVYVPMHRT